MSLHRRQFLQHSLVGTASLGLTAYSQRALQAQGSVVSSKHFEVEAVERTTVRLDYRPVPLRAMSRELPHWRYIEICDVKLRCGVTGTGETMLYYTWGVPSDKAVDRVVGRNAVEVMWEEGLGAGLQMALFDAVGRAADIPVHALLGPQQHQSTPLSWWNIDTSAADMASDCAEALRLGYMSYKTKGRPWFDIFEQLEASSKVVPENFRIDMDFNDTLRTAERGLPILKRLEQYPQVDIYESPIPQGDIAGNRSIVDATRVNVAMHYGNPSPAEVVRSGCCDGFVVGGSAARTMAAGHFCEQVQMPFWLQLVGAGLTAGFSLHFGGTLALSTWPAVNCHQLFRNDLLTEPILLENGHAAVPDRPGIGFEVDRDLVAQLKVTKPHQRPNPPRMVVTTWSDGRRMFTASGEETNFMLNAANKDLYPYYAAGADSRLLPDDGSTRWRTLYDKAVAAAGPVEE